ncbi:MAG: hypothetical protein HYR51_06635 [Candidatus Rokubacteria bacterium]|nr:hypothetical protein [Candidatus Rokubacteria bacterium]
MANHGSVSVHRIASWRHAPVALVVALAVLLVAPCAYAAPVAHDSQLAYTTPTDHDAIAALEVEAAPPSAATHAPLLPLDLRTPRPRGAAAVPARARVATHDRSPPAR